MTDGIPQPPQDAQSPLSPRAKLALTLGPLLGFGLILLVTAVGVSPGAAGFVASLAAGTFVGGGKLVILAGAVEEAPVGHWPLAALVVYIDLASAMIVMGGMHHLYKLPALGRRLAAARASGERLLARNPWMRHATWLSLAAFVAVPFNGTGALVGAVIGRLMGLSRVAIVTATGVGSFVGSTILALVSEYWAERIDALAERPLLGLLVVAVVILVSALGSRWVLGGTTVTTSSKPRVG
jgi:uncharacterized membrane protein